MIIRGEIFHIISKKNDFFEKKNVFVVFVGFKLRKTRKFL